MRDALIDLGHDAWSCDLLPSRGKHIRRDVREVLFDDWNAAIFFPECRYLCSSGLHRNKNNTERRAKTVADLEFVETLWAAPIKRKALENPIGYISTRTSLGKAAQYIQPFEFGHDASKKTGLWLEGLPPLSPTKFIAPRWVNGKPRWSNQTDSGQNRLEPSEDRGKTYAGIAAAMALQWFGPDMPTLRNAFCTAFI